MVSKTVYQLFTKYLLYSTAERIKKIFHFVRERSYNLASFSFLLSCCQ